MTLTGEQNYWHKKSSYDKFTFTCIPIDGKDWLMGIENSGAMPLLAKNPGH
jgi:hypothetical protein